MTLSLLCLVIFNKEKWKGNKMITIDAGTSDRPTYDVSRPDESTKKYSAANNRRGKKMFDPVSRENSFLIKH